MLADPKTWRAISSLMLVVFIVALIFGGSDIPQWGWLALLASGVTFAVELLLMRRGD